jgi:hypothetical protein
MVIGLILIFKGRLNPQKKWPGFYLMGALFLTLLDLTLKAGPFIQGNYGVISVAFICNALLLINLEKLSGYPCLSAVKNKFFRK